MFLRSLMYSPIIFLSSRGFSLSHWATWLLSMGLVRRPFSCRNWIPFLGFWLNCSVPVISSWTCDKKGRLRMQRKIFRIGCGWCYVTTHPDESVQLTFFFVLISINSWESGEHDEKRWGFFGVLFSAG